MAPLYRSSELDRYKYIKIPKTFVVTRSGFAKLLSPKGKLLTVALHVNVHLSFDPRNISELRRSSVAKLDFELSVVSTRGWADTAIFKARVTRK